MAVFLSCVPGLKAWPFALHSLQPDSLFCFSCLVLNLSFLLLTFPNTSFASYQLRGCHPVALQSIRRLAQCEMKQLPNRHWRRLPADARHSSGLKPMDVPTARQDRQPKYSIATFPAHRFANHRCLRTTSCVDDCSDAFRRLCPRPRAKQIPTQIESQAVVSLREHPTETAPNSLAHLFCEPVARERAPQQSECVRARCPIARPCRAPQAANVPLSSFRVFLTPLF